MTNARFSFVFGFSDIDECKGNHSCHVNASCKNTIGSHECECHPGFAGNGRNCAGEFDRLPLALIRALKWW